MDNQCVICGKELPSDMTVLVLRLPSDKFTTCCLCHEGSQELSDYISRYIKPGELQEHGGTVKLR